MEFPRIDDEHNLIARYAATLLSYETTSSDRDQQQNLANSLTSSSDSFQLTTEFKDHQNLINELEASNRQIMEEIQHLRQAKDGSFSNSNLIFELQMLKQHKGELEGRMNKLQDGRRDLMEQLEGLMGLLKSRDGAKNSQHSSPLHKVASLHHRELGHSPRHDKMYANGSASASPKLTPQHSISSTSSSVYSSRTKRQFSELFTAADAINDALSHLVNHVTTDEDTDSSPCAAFPTSHSDFDTVEY